MSNHNGNCCVLGGTGFLGSTLVEHLCRSGRTVQVIDRAPVPKYLPVGASYVRADVRDQASLRGMFSAASEVIDLIYGSVPKASFEDPAADVLGSLPVTVSIMEELARSNVDRFIYVSSGGTVYGEALSLPITEEHATRPISSYGVSKLVSERFVDLYHVCRDIPSIIARPGNAYGERQAGNIGQGFIATAMWNCLHQEAVVIFGENGTIRDYIHVEDIATALLALLDKGVVGETYNIGTGIGTDNLQIFNHVSRLAEGSDVAVPQLRFSRSRPFDVQENVLDVGKLTSETGWRPQISLREGIRRCWNSMSHDFSGQPC